jgi:hypothetical protein
VSPEAAPAVESVAGGALVDAVVGGAELTGAVVGGETTGAVGAGVVCVEAQPAANKASAVINNNQRIIEPDI